MTKTLKMLPILFFIVIMAAACSSTKAEKTEKEKKEEKTVKLKLSGVPASESELKNFSESAIREIFDGILRNDYSVFRKPFHKKVVSEPSFRQLAAKFREKFGGMKDLKYLGSLEAGIFKQTVWKARFDRSKSMDEAILRGGKDPADIPVPDLLIRLYLGNENGNLKVYSIMFN